MFFCIVVMLSYRPYCIKAVQPSVNGMGRLCEHASVRMCVPVGVSVFKQIYCKPVECVSECVSAFLGQFH